MANGIVFSLFSLLFAMLVTILNVTWTHTLSLGIALLCVLHLFTAIPAALVWKGLLYIRGTIQFIISSEKKGMSKGIENPDKALDPALTSSETKRIIFIRHGESVWNEMFNKGFMPHSFLFRLVRGVVRELMMIPTRNSVFYDSPLSAEGIEQAEDLASFLSKDHNANDKVIGDHVKMLRGDSSGSIIVSSNLRRAAATVFIALHERLKQTGEKIYLLSTLQEMSRNVDTVAVSPPHQLAPLPVLEERYGKLAYEAQFDVTKQGGNKAPTRRAYKDFLKFNEWMFKRTEGTVIAGGHSLWFKQYYKSFLPPASDHDAKTYKMVNAGAIAFTLTKAITSKGLVVYRIEPESMTTVYGGYKMKKKK